MTPPLTGQTPPQCCNASVNTALGNSETLSFHLLVNVIEHTIDIVNILCFALSDLLSSNLDVDAVLQLHHVLLAA